MDTTLDLIKKLRASGLSQMEISRRTGIPQSRVSRWEQGNTPVGADDALKLLRLVNGEGAQKPVRKKRVAPIAA